tara:strand:+ start:2733 stop:2879 length:147 start_codon:yes stop_codon:yes gene_type:complete
MKVQKAVCALAVLFVFAVSTSCEKGDLVDDQQLYEEAIDKKEIKEEDT